MLVLTRKVNQQVRLGEDITITVLRVQGNSIRIGVEAPRDVRVLRGELEPHQAAAVETLEFDLELDEPAVAADEPAVAADEPQRATAERVEPEVYQMRTVAPLSRFVRTPAASVLSTMVVR